MEVPSSFPEHRNLEATLARLVLCQQRLPGMAPLRADQRPLVIAYSGPTDAKRDPRTRCMEIIHKGSPRGSMSELTSFAVRGDRVLFFQHRPPEVPGRVVSVVAPQGPSYFAESRRATLRLADGVIFVPIRQAHRHEENREAMAALDDDLALLGRRLPVLVQLPDPAPTAEPVVPLHELEASLGVGSKHRAVIVDPTTLGVREVLLTFVRELVRRPDPA